MSMIYIWLIIMVILLIIEKIITNYWTIWFAISAFLALLVTFITSNFFIQFLVFTLGGLFFLLFLRHRFLNLIHQKRQDIEKIINQKGKVIKIIEKNKIGEVSINGVVWFALADEAIDVNEKIKVIALIDKRLKVKKDD